MRNLSQTITRWTPTAVGSSGKPSTWAKTEILGRWEEASQIFTRADGTEKVSRAVVYLAGDVATGDFLLEGSSVDTSPPATAWRVEAFSKTPNLRGTDYERKAML